MIEPDRRPPLASDGRIEFCRKKWVEEVIYVLKKGEDKKRARLKVKKMAHDTELMLRLFGFFAIFSFGTLGLFIALTTYTNAGYDTTVIKVGLGAFILLAVIFAGALFAAFMGWIGKREWKPGEEDWRRR